MAKVGPTREFIQYLISCYNERISFGNLDRDDQLNMIARALTDDIFRNIEIFSMDRDVLSNIVQDNFDHNKLIEYIKDQLIIDYELYLDEKIEEEYDFLGYNSQYVINCPEVDFEKILLAEDLRRERHRRIFDHGG